MARKTARASSTTPVAGDSTSTFRTVLSKTFPAAASTGYFIDCWALYGNSVTSELAEFQLTIGGVEADLVSVLIFSETASRKPISLLALHTQGGSPGDVTVEIKVKNGSTGTATAHASSIIIWEREADDQWVEIAGTVSETGLTYVTIDDGSPATITVPAGTSENWLIRGVCHASCESADHRWRGRLRDTTNSVSYGEFGNNTQLSTSEWQPYAFTAPVTLTGNTVFAFQHRAGNSGTTGKAKKTRLMALKIGADLDFDADTANQGSTSASFTTRSSVAITANAAPHVVYASSYILTSNSGIKVASNITYEGGELQSILTRLIIGTTLGALENFAWPHDAEAGSKTWTHGWRTDSEGTTATIGQSYLAVIEVEDLAAATTYESEFRISIADAWTGAIATPTPEYPTVGLAEINTGAAEISWAVNEGTAVTQAYVGTPNVQSGDLVALARIVDGVVQNDSAPAAVLFMAVADRLLTSAEKDELYDYVADDLAPVVTNFSAFIAPGATETFDLSSYVEDPSTRGWSAVIATQAPRFESILTDKSLAITALTQLEVDEQVIITITNTAFRARSATLTVTVSTSIAQGFENGYSFRKPIPITVGAVPGTAALTNFLDVDVFSDNDMRSVDFGGFVTSADGYDIRYELSDGTKLAHYIESYDPETGIGVVRFLVPSVATGATTMVYRYYGNASVVATEEDQTATFADYLAWRRGVDGVDISGNGRDVTPSGVSSTPGLYLTAGSFDGTNDSSTSATIAYLHGLSNLSGGFLGKSDVVGGASRGMVEVGPSTGDANAHIVWRHTDPGFTGGALQTICAEVRYTGGKARTEAEARVQTTAWSQVCITSGDGEPLDIVVDDRQPLASARPGAATLSGTTDVQTGNVVIGQWGGVPRYWDGLVQYEWLADRLFPWQHLAAQFRANVWNDAFHGTARREQAADTRRFIAMGAFVSTQSGQSIDIDVAARAIADQPTVTLTAVGSASNGTASLVSGVARYQPGASFVGYDTFTATVSDGLESLTTRIVVRVTESSQDLPTFDQSQAYGGAWYGEMTPWDNASDLNNRTRAAIAWTCRRSGTLAGWRAWTKAKPNSSSSGYAAGDGGQIRFYLFEAEPDGNGGFRRIGSDNAWLGVTDINGGLTIPLAVNGVHNFDRGGTGTQYMLFNFLSGTHTIDGVSRSVSQPTLVAGRKYWVERRNVHTNPQGNWSAWDFCHVEQRFPRKWRSGPYFGQDEVYDGDSGSFVKSTRSRGYSVAVYSDGFEEGSHITSGAASESSQFISSTNRLRIRFQVPSAMTFDAVIARIWWGHRDGYNGSAFSQATDPPPKPQPGNLRVQVKVESSSLLLADLTLSPYAGNTKPANWNVLPDRPLYSHNLREIGNSYVDAAETESRYPALPFLAPFTAATFQPNTWYVLDFFAVNNNGNYNYVVYSFLGTTNVNHPRNWRIYTSSNGGSSYSEIANRLPGLIGFRRTT